MIKKVNKIELYYEEYGEGEPLIMLHGNGENVEIFYELINKLKDSYKIYAIDSRNHGKSSKTDDYSYETMENDVEEFIKSLDYEKVNLLGFSDGAIIGILMAIKNPVILNKLILLGPNLKPENMKDEILGRIREKYEENNDPLFELMLTSPQIEMSDFKNIENEILLVYGEDDMFKNEFIKDISAKVKNGKSKVLKDHDHMSYIVDNDTLSEDIKDFLG